MRRMASQTAGGMSFVAQQSIIRAQHGLQTRFGFGCVQPACCGLQRFQRDLGDRFISGDQKRLAVPERFVEIARSEACRPANVRHRGVAITLFSIGIDGRPDQPFLPFGPSLA